MTTDKYFSQLKMVISFEYIKTNICNIIIGIINNIISEITNYMKELRIPKLICSRYLMLLLCYILYYTHIILLILN